MAQNYELLGILSKKCLFFFGPTKNKRKAENTQHLQNDFKLLYFLDCQKATFLVLNNTIQIYIVSSLIYLLHFPDDTLHLTKTKSNIRSTRKYSFLILLHFDHAIICIVKIFLPPLNFTCSQILIVIILYNFRSVFKRVYKIEQKSNYSKASILTYMCII